MAGIPAWGKITKEQEDLIENGYVYTNCDLASVSITSNSDPLEWKVRGTQKQNKNAPNQTSILTTGAVQYSFKNGKIRGKMRNEQTYKLTGEFEFPQFVPGFKAKGEINVDANKNEQAAKISGKYSADRLKG